MHKANRFVTPDSRVIKVEYLEFDAVELQLDKPLSVNQSATIFVTCTWSVCYIKLSPRVEANRRDRLRTWVGLIHWTIVIPSSPSSKSDSRSPGTAGGWRRVK